MQPALEHHVSVDTHRLFIFLIVGQTMLSVLVLLGGAGRTGWGLGVGMQQEGELYPHSASHGFTVHTVYITTIPKGLRRRVERGVVTVVNNDTSTVSVTEAEAEGV